MPLPRKRKRRMKNKVILGIDTSNYTTSLGIVSLGGELIANLKMPLEVACGERGLRQSDALFAHTKNIPIIMERAKDMLDDCEIVAVGVSDKPRNVEGSYMPCFLAGVSVASAVSTAVGCERFCFSHQCGHIMAAIHSSGATQLLNGKFAAYHVSGGTTELLLVTPTDNGFLCEKIGGTLDLNAGQAIDRIGVSLGLKFPCGPKIEELALGCDEKIGLPVSVNCTWANFSGLENSVAKLIFEGKSREYIARYTLEYVAKTLDKMTSALFSEHPDIPVLFAGGVMSNSIIKDKIRKKYNAWFAEPSLSSDNAVGIAYLTLRAYNSKNK